VQKVLLVTPLLTLRLLRAPAGGRGQDKRLAAATPAPWPAGSRWGQALGLLAGTLPPVERLRPPQTPRGEALTRAQQRAQPARPQRRRRMEPVNRRVKRCRRVQDRSRRWQEGGRALVRERCCALHNCRVRLTPWLPMV